MTDADALREKTKITYDRLVELHGPVPLKPRREPMHELISTMLSHRTTQANEALAFQRMWDRFGSWEAIRDAPLDELIEAIEPSNYPETKAPRIQEALRQIIAERGEPSIDFLRDLPAGEGLAWLMKLPGVGIKTASLVLLFCFSKPVLPVDTHVHRVTRRLGLIDPKTTAERAHVELEAIVPPDEYYPAHLNLIRHGREICHARRPRCEICPLAPHCDYFQGQLQAAKSSDKATIE